MSFAQAGIPDPFDALMVSTCNILVKQEYSTTPSQNDGYGQPPQAFITVLTNWPCRRSIKKIGKEYKQGKEFAVNEYTFFMRPPTLPSPSPTANLTPRHWIQFNNDPDPGVPGYDKELYSVTAVDDPSAVKHHLEVKAFIVLP